jgi:hypothetical protein
MTEGGYIIESDMDPKVLVIRQAGSPDRRYVPETIMAEIEEELERANTVLVKAGQVIDRLTAENDRLNRLFGDQDAAQSTEAERLRAVISKHYPTIAGHVFRLQEAHEDRALGEWLRVARDFYRALEKPEEVSDE